MMYGGEWKEPGTGGGFGGTGKRVRAGKMGYCPLALGSL